MGQTEERECTDALISLKEGVFTVQDAVFRNNVTFEVARTRGRHSNHPVSF